MKMCTAFIIEVPDSFPLVSWEACHSHGMQATADEAQGEFIRAMGCVVYRYKTVRESIDSMIAYWHGSGRTMTFVGHYLMERDLFTFFACGLSVIESLLYAVYVVATQKHPAMLPWSDLRARRRMSDQKEIVKTLRRAYPNGHPVISEIEALTDSPEWKDWNEYRNTLVHRSLPSRLYEGVAGGPPPPNEMVKYARTWSNPELRADESQMEAKLIWLAGHVERIATAAAAL